MPTQKIYQWPNWIDFLKQQEKIDLIVYGTLINRDSIQKTVSNPVFSEPVVALAVKRIFNFALIEENYIDQGGHYERSAEKNRISTLNTHYTGNISDKLNGILISVSPAEIDALAQREYGYDIIPVEYEQSDQKAFMFMARKTGEIGYRVRDDILPNESALTTCLRGASTYGVEFLNMWIDSCLLADGTTLADQHYCKKIINDFLK